MAPLADHELPPRKRVRQENDTNPEPYTQKTKECRLFAPFRAIGLVTNHVPFVLQTRSFKGATDGPRVHILTCLGKSWAMWEGEKMTLLFVGPETPDQISSMAMDGDAVWVTSGSHAIRYLRGKEVFRLSNSFGSSISHVTIFGSQVLALSEDGGRMFIWETTNAEPQSTIQFEDGFSAISVLHPATYLNKVLVASSQGSLQLWNIRTRTRIHNFTNSKLTTSAVEASPNAITALTQSPAIDVVGIGFTTGEISVFDVRADERLMRMFMEGGAVRALSFRNDGQPILASGSSSGHIAVWDLNAGGRLLHVLRGAHDSAISAVEWVPGQPILISSGEDNSVKQWLFDSPTAPPRLLKFRSGHQAPPHLIRYYGNDGKQLLTASRDRSLRCTSIVRDSRSFEMSQGSLAKKATALSIPLASLKFPPITAIASSSTRAKDWDNILTAHTDETFARSWTTLNKRLGQHSFGFAEGKAKKTVGSVKVVCVTACGNFGIAGSSTGAIYMWNMQSGIKRKAFKVGLPPAEVATVSRNSSSKKSGERCITGLASDSLNRFVIASTLDGTVNFFDFHSAKLEHTVTLNAAVVSILLHRESGLLAVVCDDMLVHILDIETKRVVRELGGFSGRVLDIDFSPDSRWLVVSSLDSIIRTFDVPTGRLIDAFRTSSVASSIAFSPANDFLATAHVESVGVYLWANRAQYAEISFQSIRDDDIVDIALPSLEESVDDVSSISALQGTQADAFSTPPQLAGDLITLTLLPRSRWQSLLNLEVIQQRNKPKEPPKVPERAPFFLPTLPGIETRFAVVEKKTREKSTTADRQLRNAPAKSESIFHQKLFDADSNGNYEDFFLFIKALSPAAIDLELRLLDTLESLQLFILALIQRLLSHRDFEAVQTFQNVFLRIHADVILENPELQEELTRLREIQRKESRRILELIASSLGTLSFVRDTLS